MKTRINQRQACGVWAPGFVRKIKTAGIAFVAAVAVSSMAAVSNASAGFEDGWQAYQRGDFLTAFNEWQPLAAQGDSRAQFNIGVMYDEGKGLPPGSQQSDPMVDQGGRSGRFASATQPRPRLFGRHRRQPGLRTSGRVAQEGRRTRPRSVAIRPRTHVRLRLRGRQKRDGSVHVDLDGREARLRQGPIQHGQAIPGRIWRGEGTKPNRRAGSSKPPARATSGHSIGSAFAWPMAMAWRRILSPHTCG